MSVYVHLNAHKFGCGFAFGLLNCSKRAAQPLGSDFCTAYFPGTLKPEPGQAVEVEVARLVAGSKRPGIQTIISIIKIQAHIHDEL